MVCVWESARTLCDKVRQKCGFSWGSVVPWLLLLPINFTDLGTAQLSFVLGCASPTHTFHLTTSPSIPFLLFSALLFKHNSSYTSSQTGSIHSANLWVHSPIDSWEELWTVSTGLLSWRSPHGRKTRETQWRCSAVISLHLMTRGLLTLKEDREVISEEYLDICKIKEKLKLSVMLATWT